MNIELKVGASASISKKFTNDEVLLFAQLSGDTNPLHLDNQFAKDAPFGERIVHGMLTASLISGLLGVTLPGKGTIYLGQILAFKAPVFIGQKVTASVTITKIREDKPIVTLRTLCINEEGEIVIEGEAVVKVP